MLAKITSEKASEDAQTVAAVDLGSNSFHMVIGRAVHGELSVLDRLREPVRLAAGLGDEGLDDKTVARALACLERFAQRLHELPPSHRRAVGTSTLRRIRPLKSGHFLSKARRALGVPIEILPGQEEGRLIYLGVAHDLADDAGRRLVVDIGGGSTECVLGERFEARVIHSLHMGCVRFSCRFFPKGELSRETFKRAETAARLELKTIQKSYRAEGWDECVGSSGTIKAVAEILRLAGWSERGITLDGIRKLKKEMIAQGSARKLSFEGMGGDRAPVLAGGVAILKAVFQCLKVDTMTASSAALREGLLYDLMGRIAHEDVRDRTIQAFSRRYEVDGDQAERVERTALTAFHQVAGTWELDVDEGCRVLSWAARLHEIGLAIGYSGFQKHGEYLLLHSNMPGFSSEDQRLLATLVRGHRGKLDATIFESLPPYHSEVGLKLCLLLRLAARLNRGRSTQPFPELRLTAHQKKLKLEFPEGWVEEHPLTLADLEVEAGMVKPAGFRLSFA